MPTLIPIHAPAMENVPIAITTAINANTFIKYAIAAIAGQISEKQYSVIIDSTATARATTKTQSKRVKLIMLYPLFWEWSNCQKANYITCI